MIPVVAIRPEPGLAATIAAGRRLGLAMHGAPLFAVGPVAWDAPAAQGWDGILAGSANAFRHGGAGLAGLAGLPVYAVGRATAEAARAHGFAVAATGEGGLQGVLDALGASGARRLRLLRLSGRDHVGLCVPEGIAIETRVVYASNPVPMPADLAALLGRGALVLLHSALAAEHLASQCARLAVPRQHVRLAALAPRILAAAGAGWGAAACAATPDDTALLALAQQMCH